MEKGNRTVTFPNHGPNSEIPIGILRSIWSQVGLIRRIYMDIEYYAVFNYNEYDNHEERYGIAITFPDIPEANTCARNDKEGIEMALEVLQLSLINDDGSSLIPDKSPIPTPLERIELGESEKVFLIKYRTQDIDIRNFQFFR